MQAIRLKPILRSSRQFRFASTQAAPPTPRSALIPTLGLFGGLVVASAIISRWSYNDEKRKLALEKLDASKIAKATPEAIAAHADEAASEEQDQGQQAAYDPVTGEINWDCPCLGGMANGPCGEEFKAAFSCFVHSTEDPKGVDCIEKFKGMQDCFRDHPEVYAKEIADDEAEDDLVSETALSASETLSSAGSQVAEAGHKLQEEASSLASSAASSVSSLLPGDPKEPQSGSEVGKADAEKDAGSKTTGESEHIGSAPPAPKSKGSSQ